MSNWEKAQYIVEQLNLKGAGLGNASWAIVSKALDDLEAAQQNVQRIGCTCHEVAEGGLIMYVDENCPIHKPANR